MSSWLHVSDAYIQNRVAGIPRFDSLDPAKVECLKIADCGGITLENNMYELRKGNKFIQSPAKEESWLKPSLAPVNACVGLPVENAIINAAVLNERYPILQHYRLLNTDNECKYEPPYTHLNKLLTPFFILFESARFFPND